MSFFNLQKIALLLIPDLETAMEKKLVEYVNPKDLMFDLIYESLII